MYRILCFGDSNTWGYIPLRASRYPESVRWPARLEAILCESGKTFTILEEGLCGRTTTIEDENESGRNGLPYLKPCIQSHQPLDLVILALGVNDLKTRFQQTAEDVARGIGQLVEITKAATYAKRERPIPVLVLAPPPLPEAIAVEAGSDFGQGSVVASQALAKAVAHNCQQVGASFMDLGALGDILGGDFIHYTAQGHEKIAAAVADLVLRMVEENQR